MNSKKRLAVLQAAKDLADQEISELQARFDLLNLAGLSLDQTLEKPQPVTAEILATRVTTIDQNKRGLIPDLSVELARRNAQRTQEDLKRLPSLLSPWGATASVTSSTGKTASWQVGLSYSITAADFSTSERQDRERSASTSAQALASTRYTEIKNQAIARQKLTSALTLARNAELQLAQARKSLAIEKAKIDAGNSSEQKLSDATISLRKAEINTATAWRDLEIELLSWQE